MEPAARHRKGRNAGHCETGDTVLPVEGKSSARLSRNERRESTSLWLLCPETSANFWFGEEGSRKQRRGVSRREISRPKHPPKCRCASRIKKLPAPCKRLEWQVLAADQGNWLPCYACELIRRLIPWLVKAQSFLLSQMFPILDEIECIARNWMIYGTLRRNIESLSHGNSVYDTSLFNIWGDEHCWRFCNFALCSSSPRGDRINRIKNFLILIAEYNRRGFHCDEIERFIETELCDSP